MPGIAVLFGLLLSAVGAIGYFQPEIIGTPAESVTGKPSITALIPAFFGIALILCGVISMMAPDMRKHAMHVAAMVALLGIIGALYRPISTLVKGGTLDFGGAPVRSQFLMAVLSAIFLALCVRSFIQARKARKAAATSSTP